MIYISLLYTLYHKYAGVSQGTDSECTSKKNRGHLQPGPIPNFIFLLLFFLLLSNGRCGVLIFFSKVESAELKKKKKGIILNSFHVCEFTNGRKIKMWEQQADMCLYLNICSQHMKNMNKTRPEFYEGDLVSGIAILFITII